MDATAGVFDEVGVRIMLLGQEEEIEEGLTQIDQYYRTRMCARLRKRFPGLSATDLAEVWQETIIDVWKTVQKKRFDAERPLGPWLYKIAFDNAADALRLNTSNEKALDRVGNELRGTSIGDWWSRLDPTERKEVIELIQEQVARLPYKQRVTIQVFVDKYEIIKSIEDDLPREVSKVTGVPETVASVKRALQEARKSIGELLQRKGYRAGGTP